MSVSLAMLLSLIYVAVLFGVTFYNYKKACQSAFKSSLFALGMFLAAHIGNSLWLMALSAEQTLAIHYLYFAGFSALLAGGLFYLNRKEMRVIMSITVILLAVEAMLGYAVYIDRNVVALNGMASPNMSLANSWFLWELRNWISQITSISVLLSLTLPKIYQVKTEDPSIAYSILEKVENYLSKFKPSERKSRVEAFLSIGGDNLCFFDSVEANKYRAEAGLLLLNEAIKVCCYEPHRTKPIGIFGRFIYWLRS